jgi:CMP-N,N'-diacetyllegionaminic acid synthase
MKFLAVIPARGGSKGVPRKNIVEIEGKPLIEYTINEALACNLFENVIVSTDDAEIANISLKLGAQVPFIRPGDLSQDTTPMIAVMQHALAWSLGTSQIDAVVLLQPTSPMRKSHHIQLAIEKYIKQEADCVVSVVKVPHQFIPESIYRLRNGFAESYILNSHMPATRRQDKPTYFARNGPAILISNANLIKAGSLYGQKIVTYEMSVEDSLDIDTTCDLEFFKMLMASRRQPTG